MGNVLRYLNMLDLDQKARRCGRNVFLFYSLLRFEADYSLIFALLLSPNESRIL